MKFRSRFTGNLKLTEYPDEGQNTQIGQLRAVKQTEVLEFSEKIWSTFGDSIQAHVDAGMLVPVDTEAKEAFPKKTKK